MFLRSEPEATQPTIGVISPALFYRDTENYSRSAFF
jgi:hypothetical protein